MSLLDELRAQGAEITRFESHCGGLIHKKIMNDNLFHYKLSWSPYNVIRAGSNGGVYWEDSSVKYMTYQNLFTFPMEIFNEDTEEEFESYFNRDSLPYRKLYGFKEEDAFIRGTLRYPGFCELWDIVVHLGLTNDTVTFNTKDVTLFDFLQTFLPNGILYTSKNQFDEFKEGKEYNEEDEPDEPNELLINVFSYLIEDLQDTIIPFETSTPANVLQWILEKKWKMSPKDKDRVVMIHQFYYTLDGFDYFLQSILDITGEDNKKTAMAKTVGLPMAFAALGLVEGKITQQGLVLPTSKEVYSYLLPLLEKENITFVDKLMEA